MYQIFLLLLFSTLLAADRVPISFGAQGALDIFTVNRSYGGELRKRVPTLTYQDALVQGQFMLDRLNGQRSQSQWSTVEELVNNGYDIDEPKEDVGETSYYNGPGGPYEQLNIRQSDGREIIVSQLTKFANCHSTDNDATDALFYNVFNVQGRAIIGTYNFGPISQIRDKPGFRDIPYAQLGRYVPDVYKWSDIVWILWAHQAQEAGLPPSSLKYIFKHNVVTENTARIMDRVAGVEPKQFYNDWPGIRLANGSPRFRALLGTPHGKGIVFLITQHMNDLPGKTVETITMFTDDAGEYSLLFTLSG